MIWEDKLIDDKGIFSWSLAIHAFGVLNGCTYIRCLRELSKHLSPNVLPPSQQPLSRIVPQRFVSLGFSQDVLSILMRVFSGLFSSLEALWECSAMGIGDLRLKTVWQVTVLHSGPLRKPEDPWLPRRETVTKVKLGKGREMHDGENAGCPLNLCLPPHFVFPWVFT